MTLKELIKRKTLRLKSVPDALLTEIEKIQKQIFSTLIATLDAIDKQGGFLKADAGNIRKLTDITSELKGELFGADYADVIQAFAQEYSEQKTLNDEIFKKEFKDFSGSPLADELLKKSQSKAVDLLLGSPLDTEFLTPLEQLLSDSISTGASWRDTVAAIREFVEGSEERDGKLLQYAKQISHDAFAFSDRSYTSAIADELESEWFLWSGGELPTSRCLCEKNHEKYFHYKEIEAFGRGENLGECKVGDLWDGAVPSTNEKTIWIYVGGYGCIHSLLPVSIFSVPPDVLERNMQNGNYQPSEKEAELLGVDPSGKTQKDPEPEKFEPAKTVNEANSYAINTLGAEYANYSGMSVEVANSLNESVFAAQQLMPDLKINGLGSSQKRNIAIKKEILGVYRQSESYKKLADTFGEAAAEKQAQRVANRYAPKIHSGAIAYSSDIGIVRLPGGESLDLSKYRGIFVNEKYGKSKANLDAVVVSGEKTGWFTKGANDANYIMQHELGHEIDKLIKFKNDDDFKKIFDREHRLGLESVTQRLSKYGATAGKLRSHRPDEMIAEAWAEYVTSSSPRPLAKEIGDLMIKKYYEDFVQGTVNTTFAKWKEMALKSIRI